jgi:hypothetical protein
MEDLQRIRQRTRATKAPRGVLSFITNDSLQLATYSAVTNVRRATATRGVTKRARRRQQLREEGSRPVATSDGDTSDDFNSPPNVTLSSSLSPPVKSAAAGFTSITSNVESLPPFQYGHNNSEFTLLFFCAPYCRHSLRFAPKLAEFVHSQNERFSCNLAERDPTMESSRPNMAMQCICIPDSVDINDVQHMLHGTGFFYFPKLNLDTSFKSIKALISIQWIPAVVVIDNLNGKIITEWGRTAIEFNEEGCVDAWRNGYSGANYFWRLLTVL